GAGERARPRSARSDAAQDPATRPRASNLRAALATGDHQRHRPPSGGIRARSDRGPRLLVALRGRDAVRQVAAAKASDEACEYGRLSKAQPKRQDTSVSRVSAAEVTQHGHAGRVDATLEQLADARRSGQPAH